MRAESIARWVYTVTFCDEDQPPGPAILLRRLIGTDRIAFVDGRSTLTREDGNFRVRIERGLDLDRTCLRLATACAVVALMHHGHTVIAPVDLRRVALAVLIPRPALRHVLRSYGPRPLEVSRIFHVSKEMALERMQAVCVRLASGRYRRFPLQSAS